MEYFIWYQSLPKQGCLSTAPKHDECRGETITKRPSTYMTNLRKQVIAKVLAKDSEKVRIKRMLAQKNRKIGKNQSQPKSNTTQVAITNPKPMEVFSKNKMTQQPTPPHICAVLPSDDTDQFLYSQETRK